MIDRNRRGCHVIAMILLRYPCKHTTVHTHHPTVGICLLHTLPLTVPHNTEKVDVRTPNTSCSVPSFHPSRAR